MTVTPESMGLDLTDFLSGKLPVYMSNAELISAMREIMTDAFSYSFNPDIAYFLWTEIDRRMIAGTLAVPILPA